MVFRSSQYALTKNAAQTEQPANASRDGIFSVTENKTQRKGRQSGNNTAWLPSTALVLSLLIASVLLPSYVVAQASAQPHAQATDISQQIRPFNIPRQRADGALTAFGQQADLTVVYQYDRIKNHHSNQLQGDYKVAHAVAILLANTGLSAEFNEARYLIIRDQTKGKTMNTTNSSKRKTVLAGLVGLFAATGGVGSALAQGGEAATGQSAIDEIIVTANKREQNIKDVPMSIAAMTGEDIEDAGIQNISSLSYSIPNMSVWERGPGFQTITIRGIGNVRGSSSLIGVYLDEAPVSAIPNAQLDLQTIDLARIEVLRGPQGTLYGQGSVGGTVRFITNEPSFEGAIGEIGMSVYHTNDGGLSKEVQGFTNLPIIDEVLAFRIAGTYKDKSGWIDQPATNRENINDNELSNLRLKGLWRASDDLSVKLMFVNHRNDADGDNLVNIHPVKDSNYQSAVDPTKSNEITDNYDVYNVTMEYNLGVANLTSSSSYFEVEKLQLASSQFALFAGATVETELLGDFRHDVEVFTQELRLTNDSDSTINWTVGVFYSDLERRFFRPTFEFAAGGVFLFGLPPLDDFRESQSIAYFGDISFDISERLTLGLGTRYFEDDRKFNNSAGSLAETFDNLSSKAYLSFAINDNNNFYINISEGFRSGGFNSPTAVVNTYDPETVLSYEFGIKSSLLERRLDTEFGLFFSDYNDFQALFFDATSGANYTANPGKAEIKGVEWDIQYSVSELLSVGFSGNVTDGEFTEINSTPSTQIEGDPLDFVPEYSYSLNARYQFEWSQGVAGSVQLDFNRQGKNSTVNRTSGLAQEVFHSKPISLLNGRIGIEWDSVELEIFGRNLLDEDNPTTASISRETPQERPRTFGVDVRYRF